MSWNHAQTKPRRTETPWRWKHCHLSAELGERLDGVRVKQPSASEAVSKLGVPAPTARNVRAWATGPG